MQMVKRSIGILFAVWLALLLFMPKEEFYYAVEKKLAAQDITLNEKSIDEGLFSLTIKDITVYAKGVALAKIKEIDFFTLLFYNTLHIDDLAVDEVLHSQMPKETKRGALTYHMLHPFSISIDANGSFGYAKGLIFLKERKIYIGFVKPKEIESIKHLLKKGKEGWFYEKSF